jgi:hypothetical protein
MTQMLRQCVQPDQKDWAEKLPAIEFAMNLARSETTGFSPFFLNYARTPRAMIWDNESEYPGVRKFAARMKEALMKAHDAIIDARIHQTDQANKGRRKSGLAVGELVYLSTKNLKLPKKRARKLVPKYLGPFRITQVVSPGASYKLELSQELKVRGIHDVFHASLLRVHIPNDDRRFPGRQMHQLPGFGQTPKEWAVDRILSHVGKGADASFEIQWATGDVTWAPYAEVKHLAAMDGYCEAMGIKHPRNLPASDRKTSPEMEQVSVHSCRIFTSAKRGLIRGPSAIRIARDGRVKTHNRHQFPHNNSSRIMSANPAHYNTADRVRFENYADALRQYGAGFGPNPGPTPTGYREFFRVQHKYAPVPEDYTTLRTKAAYPAEVQRTAMADVSMSTAALGTILNSQHKLMNSVIAMNKKPDYRPAVFRGQYRPNRGNHFGGRGNYRGRNGVRNLVGQNISSAVDTHLLMQLTDRFDGTGDVGGQRKRARPYRKQRNSGNNDVASDVATAGGLTDNEDDGIMVTNEDVVEEGEFDQDVDNGFNVAGV